MAGMYELIRNSSKVIEAINLSIHQTNKFKKVMEYDYIKNVKVSVRIFLIC